jgi:hypothetical protein
MKKFLSKTVLLVPIIIGMILFSCKPDSFTEQDAMLLQSKLDKEKILLQDSLNLAEEQRQDSLNQANQSVTYTLSLVDASVSTLLKGSNSGADAKGISGATVSITQGSKIVTQTTDANGVVTFSGLIKGMATLHIKLTGYSDVNAVIDFAYYGIATNTSGGIQVGNIIPMIPTTGTSTGTIKGKVTYESDLTNKTPENAPAGTKVIATVSTNSAAFNSINTGVITSMSYDNLSLEAVTDANGDYTMTVPATTMGLDYALKVSDFTGNQSLLMTTKAGVAVTGVQTVPTNFGSTYSSGSSAIPTVSAAFVTIGAPDYTYTPASATTVITNTFGIDYIQITYAGSYYYGSNVFNTVPITSPLPGTGGSSAYADITVNSAGQITAFSMSSKGSLYASSVENSTFTLPYIKTAAIAEVLTVNGSGAITSWRVMPANTGEFYSTSNLNFIRATGSGTGAVLPMPTIYDGGASLYFSSSTYTPSPALGSGYVVGDHFTLTTQTGMSDVMTGKIHLTTGSVTAINVVNEGANYVSGKVDIVIASPGTTGTIATATAAVSNGRISTITLTNNGTNYSSAPAVTILNKVEQIQAKATATVGADGTISSLTMTNNGNGYLAVPTVTITPSITGVGSGASAVATLSGVTVGSLSLVTGGTGYIGVNTPTSVQNAPSSVSASAKGSGTTIANIYLGTGKRSIEN